MTKKDQAFDLFRQGRRPGDQEVKELGLSAKTRFNYFQEFKKAEGETGVGDTGSDDITDLKRERARLSLLSQIEELEGKREKLPERMGNLEKQSEAIVEYLGVLLDNMTTVMSVTLGMAVVHLERDHEITRESLQEWEPFRNTEKAIDEIKKLEPIPEKLRKLMSRLR